MIDLPISISSMGVRYGASKLFQILIPLSGYMIIRDLIIRGFFLRTPLYEKLYSALPDTPFWQRVKADFPQVFDQTLGFMSWKIGCDLGFFLIVTGLGPWSRAFTWAGLIPYTIVQYFIYYLIGRKMIIEGMLNPLKPSPPRPHSEGRPPLWRRLMSKYLHEDLNATSEDIPLKQIILKPFADYGGLVLSWSIYTVGIFFTQSGELNFAPLIHFAFFQMFTFYLVNTYGYILGFNIGEWIHLRIAWFEEKLSAWRRQQARQETGAQPSLGQRVNHILETIEKYWRELKYAFLWRLEFFMGSYGLGRRWFLSAMGGVLCVTLVAPGFSGAIFAVGEDVSHLWFSEFGELSEVQLAQTRGAISTQVAIPDSELIVSKFPAIWQALYRTEIADTELSPLLSQLEADFPTLLDGIEAGSSRQEG